MRREAGEGEWGQERVWACVGMWVWGLWSVGDGESVGVCVWGLWSVGDGESVRMCVSVCVCELFKTPVNL